MDPTKNIFHDFIHSRHVFEIKIPVEGHVINYETQNP